MILSKPIELPAIIRDNFFYKLNFYHCSVQTEVFRILVAGFCIINFSTILLDYNVLLAPNGLVSWEVTNANSFWFELHPQKIADFLSLSPQAVMIAISTCYLCVLSLLLLGIWPNLTAFVSLICFTLITAVITPFAYGMDVYQAVCLFFLCFFPQGYRYSLIRKQPGERLVKNQQLSIRTLQLYLIITYLSAGFEKAVMPSWWNGKFIFFLINDPTIVTSPLLPKSAEIWLYLFFGITVVLAESLYFLLVWFRTTRIYILIVILSMHVFIALFMDLFFFGLLLFILNISCWYPALLADIKPSKKL